MSLIVVILVCMQESVNTQTSDRSEPVSPLMRSVPPCVRLAGCFLLLRESIASDAADELGLIFGAGWSYESSMAKNGPLSDACCCCDWARFTKSVCEDDCAIEDVVDEAIAAFALRPATRRDSRPPRPMHFSRWDAKRRGCRSVPQLGHGNASMGAFWGSRPNTS